MLSETLSPDVSRHKCMIYDGHPREQLPVVVPFLAGGLGERRKCLYLGPPDMVETVREALAARGVDVPGEAARGALLLSSDRGHLVDGAFDPAGMIDSLRSLADQAVKEGFDGLCATGDMRWELGDDANFERLAEYEALLEQVFREKPIVGICQYHRETVPARALRDALLTHRSLYVGSELNRDNLFYIPPEILLKRNERIDGEVGQWMCDQITRILRAERERDEALEKLASLNRDLERRVKERTAELEAFTYSVSHDLRAPLRAIQGFGRMLAEEQGPSLDAEGRRRLGVMVDGAGRMGGLIDALLEFSRAGRSELRSGSVDMTTLARNVLAELNAPAVELGELPTGEGDVALLRQVFVNLIGNAIKYSSKRAGARIEVGGRREEVENVYWVKDNGAGFDPAYAHKLFGVFQRLHGRDYEGTGIGLALCKRVIERHGGRIWAEGAEGQGATFWFSLPRKA